MNITEVWSPSEPWIFGEAYGNVVFAPERIVRALADDLDLLDGASTFGELRSLSSRLTVIDAYDDEGFDNDDPYVASEQDDYPLRLATIALDCWNEDLDGLASEADGLGGSPYLKIIPANGAAVAALLSQRGYAIRRDQGLIARTQR